MKKQVYFSVKKYGAKGNGTRNDTLAFIRAAQAAEDATPWYYSFLPEFLQRKKFIVFVPNGTYRLADTLEVKRRRKIHGEKS